MQAEQTAVRRRRRSTVVLMVAARRVGGVGPKWRQRWRHQQPAGEYFAFSVFPLLEQSRGGRRRTTSTVTFFTGWDWSKDLPGSANLELDRPIQVDPRPNPVTSLILNENRGSGDWDQIGPTEIRSDRPILSNPILHTLDKIHLKSV